MWEVEAKLRVADPDAVRQALAARGAVSRDKVAQEDTFFAHPQRDFARTDEALRLRRDGDRLELTYKGPRKPGVAKVREEHNVALGDDPTPILVALGLRPVCRLRKTREVFSLQGLEVVIDHLEGLGWFVEVEATGEDILEMSNQVEGLLPTLGLSGAKQVSTSYLELARDAGAASYAEL